MDIINVREKAFHGKNYFASLTFLYWFVVWFYDIFVARSDEVECLKLPGTAAEPLSICRIPNEGVSLGIPHLPFYILGRGAMRWTFLAFRSALPIRLLPIFPIFLPFQIKWIFFFCHSLETQIKIKLNCLNNSQIISIDTTVNGSAI